MWKDVFRYPAAGGLNTPFSKRLKRRCVIGSRAGSELNSYPPDVESRLQRCSVPGREANLGLSSFATAEVNWLSYGPTTDLCVMISVPPNECYP